MSVLIILMRPVEIDQMDVIDILNDDGSLKPIREWPKIWRTTLSGFDVIDHHEHERGFNRDNPQKN